MNIEVGRAQRVVFSPPIEEDQKIIAAMSMAVVPVGDYYDALYRQVREPKPGQIPESVLALASSKKGVDFRRNGQISVRPTRELDRLAVEDPTIVVIDGIYYVFHSAVSQNVGKDGVQVAIQVVTGKSLQHLESDKQIVLTPKDVRYYLGERADMVKEPEFFQTRDGRWHMIYEHTGKERSEIAIAESPQLTGPYRNHRPLLEVRENAWDSQHLSPGPLLMTSYGDVLMIYNGRGPKNSEDGTPSWAIGYVVIDARTGAVSNRSDIPLIRPPDEMGPGRQLIAFASSLVLLKGRTHRLCYTVADTRMEVVSVTAHGI